MANAAQPGALNLFIATRAGQELFRKLWSERKAKQLNNGPCAAQVVDCDCDSCIDRDVVKQMRAWIVDAGSARAR